MSAAIQALRTRIDARTREIELPSWAGTAVPLLLVGLVAAYPVFDPTTFGISRIELLLYFIMAAIALNMVHGYGGVLVVGQPAMMTVAGFASGILSIQLGWNVWITILLGIFASVLLSVFMALPSLRVRGWYLAVLSIMAVVLMPDLALGFPDLTGGSDGLPAIPPMEIAGQPLERWMIFEAVLLLTILCWLAARNLVKSGWGTSVVALRDYPYMAASTGVSTVRVRGALCALTGVPCGIAGALYAHSQQFFSANDFNIKVVLILIGGVLLGGRGTLWGPVIGVAIFGGISYWIGPFSPWNPFFLGVGVMVAALLFRLGIVGTVQQYWATHRARRKVATRLFAEDVEPTVAISPVETPPLLEVRGVSKHFGGNQVLRDVDLTLTGGSIVALVGANGSGKTTLLNCVSGFYVPDEGRIELNGRDIMHVPPHRRPHLGMARTFQVPGLIEERTVLENVQLGAFGLDPQSATGSIFRLPSYRARESAATERAIDACRAVGLTDRAIYGKASDLTLALRRMVEIARALAADASVICLDEPVAGLRQDAQDRVMAVLRSLAESGRAILLIEHNLPFVLSLSDRVVLLKDGEVVDEGAPIDVGDRDRPLGAYFYTFVPTADRKKLATTIAAAEQARESSIP